MAKQTLFDKIWDAHTVVEFSGGWALMHIDRNLLHDLSGTVGLRELQRRNIPVLAPELAYATPDHAVSSAPGRDGSTFSGGAMLYEDLRRLSRKAGIAFFDLGESGHGIVHVIAPELGIVQPGTTVICGDSHTCTNGALGAIAFGVGASELMHSLATQTLLQRRPKNMRVHFEGSLATGVSAKDLILHAIAILGANAGTGYAIEYTGDCVARMSIEERMTLCNLSIEMGSKIGMIAPDEKTFAYLKGRQYAPEGALFAQAVAHWKTLFTDDDAVFDRVERVDASAAQPMITWGTSPEHAMAIGATIPLASSCDDAERRKNWTSAQSYMGVVGGEPIVGLRIDRVFIGSCTNARLSDLREAAFHVAGKQVASGVVAWIVPGSEDVKLAAEAEGLDGIFKAAGFEWREPGCSMCAASNGERGVPQERVLSTTNRNFVGRQGPGVRTHLVSPATAAISAIAGVIRDPRVGV
ncbi:3-isopropylmalate dehydratase large subunit [Hydrogenophaga sp.]|uniref:3-isopropylmalate dehydratase large subunit n=1 Tax=Hydrogenophaga sp. TaxID=1904254 RepID=UPI0027170A54|nr:3-isopropylmalate dehydratase large subunit [Hydrogenophaga sp.]MDO9435389.1 3-isopropylmalate dehydratase large subunit [Hydrogenophaga sp.]